MAAAITSAGAARADLDLRWDAPAGCPQRDQVLARIRGLAGTALDETARLSVDGTIARAGARYFLTLLVGDGRETRERVIASESCADLAGAAAVSVALLLGVDASSIEDRERVRDAPAPSEREPASGVQREDTTEPQPAPPEERTPPEERQRWAAVVRAPIGAADVGPLPRPAFGIGFGAGLRYDAWRLLALGRLSLHQTIDDSDASGTFGAELERATAELVGCHGWRSLRFEIAPCVGFALELLNARGFGDGVAAASERAVWPAASAGGVAHWYATESLAFFLGMTGYVELSRPRIVIEGLGELAQLAPVALGGTFGAEWIL